jgi:hypothetical protein
MILPESLQPLPVAPISEQEAALRGQESEAFVSDQCVRQLLVGPLSVGPQRLIRGDGYDGFAGSSDSPFISLARAERHEDAPARAFAPGGPHPALAAPRRAAPPVPRTEIESQFGRRPVSERRMVIAMGVAAVAVLVGAVLSGFTPLEFEKSAPEVEKAVFEPQPVPPPVPGDPAIAFSGNDAAMP